MLSFIPLCGCLIAVVAKDGFNLKVKDKPLHSRFRITDYHTLNDALVIIGIFHTLVSYAIRKLMDRVATQFRTRAFLDKSASTAQLLNSLPGSPDSGIFFKSRIARIIRYVGLFSGFLSIAGGVLYKQGIVLSAVRKQNHATHPHVFVTNCTANFTDCPYSRYYAYGVALHEAKMGGVFSKGFENLTDSDDYYRLAFVSAPWVPHLTSPVKNITKIRAKSFAMVSEYRSTTLAELPKDNVTWKGVHNDQMTVHLSSFLDKDVDWSFSATNLSDGTTQSVRGITYYCTAECEWRTRKNHALFLYSYQPTNCTRHILGTWSDASARGITHALFSDILDWQPEPVLHFAYVVPAMYATIALGQWDGLWTGLKNITLVEPLLTETLNCTQTSRVLAIELNGYFVAYIVLLVLIFIALWISGFVDTKVFVTEWAPLWFGLLSDSEQEDIRRQIRDNLGLEGLEEIRGEYIPLTMMDLEETTDS